MQIRQNGSFFTFKINLNKNQTSQTKVCSSMAFYLPTQRTIQLLINIQFSSIIFNNRQNMGANSGSPQKTQEEIILPQKNKNRKRMSSTFPEIQQKKPSLLKQSEHINWSNGDENISEDSLQLTSFSKAKLLKQNPKIAFNVFQEKQHHQNRNVIQKTIEKNLKKESLLNLNLNINLNKFKGRNTILEVFSQFKPQPVSKSHKILFDQFIKIKKQPIQNYYKLQQKIAEGNDSSIYRATNISTKQIKAIKIIKINEKCNQKEYQKIQQEITIHKQLDHINIAKLYDVYLYKHKYYLVIEYCRGGNMYNNLNNLKKIPDKKVAFLMKQILSFLCYLHDKKIAYRNLKLKNIMFFHPFEENQDMKIKLIDFGKSKQIRLPQENNLVYQNRKIQASHLFQNDMWSCGMIFYLLLKGNLPVKKRISVQISEIPSKDLTFTGPAWEDVNEKAKDLLKSMLEKKASKRISARKALNHPFIIESILKRNYEPSSNYEKKNIVDNMKRKWKSNRFVILIKTFLSTQQTQYNIRQKMAIIFDRIDKDGNGTIQKLQLQELYLEVKSTYNQSFSEEQLRQIFQNVDLDKSGKIDFGQFLTAMADKQIFKNEKALDEVFDHIDTDRNGFLEKANLLEAMKGQRSSQIIKIMSEFDENGDFRISRSEFKKYMMNLKM